MGTDIIGGDIHNRWGQTNTMWGLSLVDIQSATEENQDFQNLPGGWVGGWGDGYSAGNNTTSWLHLASWNLPDFQLS